MLQLVNHLQEHQVMLFYTSGVCCFMHVLTFMRGHNVYADALVTTKTAFSLLKNNEKRSKKMVQVNYFQV